MLTPRRCWPMALAAGVALTACEVTAPDTTRFSPLISDLAVDFVTGNFGTPINFPGVYPNTSTVLRMRGTPVSLASGELPAGRAVLLIRTSSGDVEETLLWLTCRDESGTDYGCNRFSVGLKPGVNLAAFLDRLRKISAVPTYVTIDTSSVSVFLKEGNVFGAVAAVQRWPEVRRAQLERIWFLLASDAPTFRDLGGVPVVMGPPVRGDHILQLQPNDTVWVRYQGGRTELEEMVIVPE